jgi:hypothetical protein
MSIQEIIKLLENKIIYLNSQKYICEVQGNIQCVEGINEQIITTNISLQSIKTLI